MTQDALTKTKQGNKLNIVEVFPVQKKAPAVIEQSSPNQAEDVIVDQLALYFVSLARSMSNSSASKSS